MFDEAARAKGLETRKRNALDRKLKEQNAVAGTATTEISSSDEAYGLPDYEVSALELRNRIEEKFPVDNWNNIPLEDAKVRLSLMKQEYDRAAQIVLQRQSKEPVVYTCWSQSHKEHVAKQALAQCKKQIADGKWASRDDGAKDEEGKISPAVTCSMLCYMSYQEYRSKAKSRVYVRQ